MEISFQINPSLDVHDLIDVLEKSSLGLRRPLHDLEAMEQMLVHANVYIGAYEGTKLVGLARAMTDFVYTTYLADLAVDEAYQQRGIGKQLIRELKN
jgi:ribosomal protein S18 acetylase RimI-like enzyme